MREMPVARMGKANAGQRIIIKLDDYSYQQLGLLEGEVESLDPSPNENLTGHPSACQKD